MSQPWTTIRAYRAGLDDGAQATTPLEPGEAATGAAEYVQYLGMVDATPEDIAAIARAYEQGYTDGAELNS